MAHQVGPERRIVIPKARRDELGIEPGDKVGIVRDDDHVAIRPTARRRPLRGRFRGSALVDELSASRTADHAPRDRP